MPELKFGDPRDGLRKGVVPEFDVVLPSLKCMKAPWEGAENPETDITQYRLVGIEDEICVCFVGD